MMISRPHYPGRENRRALGQVIQPGVLAFTFDIVLPT